MEESYWSEYIDIKIAEEYFFLYLHNSLRWIRLINAVCFVVSFTGVVAWITDNLGGLPASLIILVAQIVSVLQPLYPFSDRRFASKCILSEYSQQALLAEQTLNDYLYGSLDDHRLSVSLKKLQKNVSLIEGKYSATELFPRKKRLHEKAEKNVAQYVKTHYNSIEEGFHE